MSGEPAFGVSAPTYLPSGYVLRHQLEGSTVSDLGTDRRQISMFYGRGWALQDIQSPIEVCIAPPGASHLKGTESHPGMPVDLGVSGTVAVYHDGINGPPTSGTRLSWLTACHSITVHTHAAVYAVRAPRDAVGADELVKIALSMQPK